MWAIFFCREGTSLWKWVKQQAWDKFPKGAPGSAVELFSHPFSREGERVSSREWSTSWSLKTAGWWGDRKQVRQQKPPVGRPTSPPERGEKEEFWPLTSNIKQICDSFVRFAFVSPAHYSKFKVLRCVCNQLKFFSLSKVQKVINDFKLDKHALDCGRQLEYLLDTHTSAGRTRELRT